MSTQANYERYAADLAYEHDLTLPQGRKLADLAINALDPSVRPESPRHLSDADVTEAYVWSPLGPDADEASVQALEDWVKRALEDGYDTAGAWFAQACVAEHTGDHQRQRQLLEVALTRDSAFRPALVDLGFLAFVEGDVRRARALLGAARHRRAADMLHTLSHYEQRPCTARNQPCWCGSGKKTKYCAPGHNENALEHRAYWLWEKAATWLHRLPQLGTLCDIGYTLAEADDWCDDPDAIIGALQHPLTESVALCEGGLLRRFVEQLGPLLPVDERSLATAWTEMRHRVWRVEATTPGESLELTDLVDGDTVTAMNGAVSRCTTAGEVVFGLVVPRVDGWMLPAHPVGLTTEMSDELVDLIRFGDDPLEIAVDVFRWARGART